MAKLQIKLVRSTIGTTPNQRKNVEALGLRKREQVVVKEDNAQMRGMINKVRHLVQVTEITALTDTVILPNPIAREFVTNFIAARIAMKFNPKLTNFYEEKANELLFKAQDKGPASEESITDVYFGGNYGSY